MEAKEEEMKTIEELAQAEKTPAWQLAGMMEDQQWAPGKKLTLKAYQEGLNSFLKAPMNGRPIKEKLDEKKPVEEKKGGKK